MKKCVLLIFVIAVFLSTLSFIGFSAAAEPLKMNLDATTVKAMSIFISNFTELDMYEIPDVSKMTHDELVYFGVGHNFINNPKQIRKAAGGKLSVSGKQTGESLRRYFALDITPSASAKYANAEYDYSNGNYAFVQPADRTIYYARVSEAYIDGDRILMIGEIYNLKNEKDIRGPFYAYAKPWKYGGRDTWALLSLHEGKHSQAAPVIETKPIIAEQPSPIVTSVPTQMTEPAKPGEGDYMVIEEIAPIMKTPGRHYITSVEYGRTILEYDKDIDGVVVYGNKLRLRKEDVWFALLSPEDGRVLGYIPDDAVKPFPDFEPTGGALYMVARDNPVLSLLPDENDLPSQGLSLLKGEVVPSLGKRDGKVILSFGSLDGESGVGGRYAWADEKDLIALASYVPDNTKADRALIPSIRRLEAWGDDDERIEELPKEVVDSIEKRGFLIDDKPILPKYRVFVDDMADLYQATGEYEADFITADIFLHSFHLIFDQMLQKFERTYMAPKLAESLSGIISFLGTTARYIDDGGYAKQGFITANDMLTVARALLLGNSDPYLLTTSAEMEINRIIAASEMEESGVTGQKLDYTLFKPRGHYTLSPEFERYFRAMSYLGLAELPLFDDEGKPIMRNIAATAIISLTLEAHIESWIKFEDSMNFLVGVPNAGDPQLYRELTRNRLGEGGAETWKLINDEIAMAELAKAIADNMPGPKIQSVVEIDKENSDFEDRYPVFRISPKRFTYDAYIMNWLTSPRVGTDDNARNLPKGTDVMAVFGSSVADVLSKNDYDKKNYETNLAMLKDEVAGYLARENTVYASWLEAFRAGFQDSGSDQFFYRNEGWQWKKLATNLASWAELKRDTILYAEQSMAEMGAGGDWYAGRFQPPQPRGYVEPDPQFFSSMLEATGFMLSFIREYGVEDNDDEDETPYSGRLGKFSDLLAAMRDIARKQVAKETLTLDEYAEIKETARAFDAGLLIPGRDAVFTMESAELRKMAVVADVATNGWDKTVLEAGVGVPRAIYVFANDKSGGARVAKGYVFSYYEFEHPMSKRMTDQEWREIVYDPNRAEELEKYRPEWHEEFKKNTR